MAMFNSYVSLPETSVNPQKMVAKKEMSRAEVRFQIHLKPGFSWLSQHFKAPTKETGNLFHFPIENGPISFVDWPRQGDVLWQTVNLPEAFRGLAIIKRSLDGSGWLAAQLNRLPSGKLM